MKTCNSEGRLAKSWQISEDAYFYVNDSAVLPNGRRPDAQNIVALLEQARQNDKLADAKLKKSLANIKNISLIAPRHFSDTRKINDPADNRKKIEVRSDAAAPARIKLHLEEVDQDLFENLTGLLGEDYFHSFRPAKMLTTQPELPPARKDALAKELLPAVEHNPVIEFYAAAQRRFSRRPHLRCQRCQIHL